MTPRSAWARRGGILSSSDTLIYDVSPAQDVAYILGGPGYDTLTVNSGGQSFTLVDEYGGLIYTYQAPENSRYLPHNCTFLAEDSLISLTFFYFAIG